MPALEDLDARLAKDEIWKSEYEANLMKAREVQDQVPLIHVLRATPEILAAVFTLAPYELAVSSRAPDPAATTKGTVAAEEKYDLGSCVYFYAGRVFPLVGGLGIAFANGCEAGKDGDATPFDTGGLCKYINVYFDKDEASERAFVLGSRIPLSEWRIAYGRYIAAYFHPLSAYWQTESLANWTVPPRWPDPEGVLDPAHDNHWPAWTFEVRFTCGQYVYDCWKLAASEPVVDHLFEIMKNTDDPEIADKIASIAGKFLSLNGSLNYIVEMETWVKKECRI